MGHWGQYRQRFLGDANKLRTRHVHDLSNEKTNCALQGVEWAGNAVTFATKKEALDAGFKPCIFCMPYDKGAS